MKKSKIQRENNHLKEEFDEKYKKIMEDFRVNQMKLNEIAEEKNNLMKYIKEISQKNENKENKNQINLNNSGFFNDENSLKLKINRRLTGENYKNEMSFEDNLEHIELTSKILVFLNENF